MEQFSLVPGTPVQQLIFPRGKANPLTTFSQITWHVFVCDSGNYMEKSFRNYFQGKSHFSYVKECFQNCSRNHFLLERKQIVKRSRGHQFLLNRQNSSRKKFGMVFVRYIHADISLEKGKTQSVKHARKQTVKSKQ